METKKLKNVWNFIDEISDDEEKDYFELDDILYNISMKIFDYRTSNGLTQKQLAEKLGIKQSMVSKLESGEYNPTIEQLWKISKKLGWKFNVIFEESNSIEANVWDEVDIQSEDLDIKFDEKLVENA
ncbi:helix-turn-helix transcriptional regulator [Caloramator proteoclasticus]|uniref:Helix-turn-helix n=1 Tax=Caloramator proteoclasticus DSM 10124 TaxID=1121262 RepID=A0A1M4ZP55_9CLOT|nr:helix-turn-helix transcriptional regulator [Caloramator proteoclasticus]SHF19577.1 Helix-turn-helix [Caloramator proteoclasticus DSM 10124]